MSSQNKPKKETKKCETCGKKYTDAMYKWCKSCQVNNFKNNFSKWTSGNKKIDDFIQGTQLKADKPNDIVFEWISYDQFNNVKEISKNSAIVYSAIWRDGPLYYNYEDKDENENSEDENEDLEDENKDSEDENEWKWTRKSDKKITLKCSNSSQSVSEFLNEVWCEIIFYNLTFLIQ
jgi:predicted  nucleic acid-binding Zn-ribbon protein